MEFDFAFRGSWLLALLGFGVGAIVGSYLATILVRWPQGRSAATGRSQCDGCGARLRAVELVPILSHLASGGRCRRCGAGIDRRHIVLEIIAGAIAAAALLVGGWPIGLAGAVLGWWLLILAALDVEHHWLPDRLTLPLIPAGLIAAALGVGEPLFDRSVGAAAGFLILWSIGRLYQAARGRHGLGGGDPKLLAAIGAWSGWQLLPFVLLGTGLIGLIALAIRLLRGGRVTASDRLPLGALMAAAAWPLWILLASH